MQAAHAARPPASHDVPVVGLSGARDTLRWPTDKADAARCVQSLSVDAVALAALAALPQLDGHIGTGRRSGSCECWQTTV